MADTRIAYREMAEQSISRSFKGILRVANIQELNPDQDDIFLNTYYYGKPEGYISDQADYIGYDSAKGGLDGSLHRYNFSNDSYKNKKIPVTDSLGYYMNINVGVDGTTIGHDEFNNGNNADKQQFKQVLDDIAFEENVIFPVISSPSTIVGRIAIKRPENKNTVNDGVIYIDSSVDNSNIKGQLIVNNNYDHSPENIIDGMYKPLTDDPIKRRTIYKITNSNIKPYDALIHKQDNIDEHNLLENNVLDSFVDGVNLKDYIKGMIDKWMGSNTVEVPSGNVIWQYINLEKWYSYSGSINYNGNNPPMGTLSLTGDYIDTLYQGVVRPGLNCLVASGSADYKSEQLKEIIPLYKRDYTLCDGSTYIIYMLFPEGADKYNYVSYERFINLFFAIDYRYTDIAVIRPHYRNVPVRTVDDETIYGWAGGIREASVDCDDKQVLFGLDLMSMFAIKALYNELSFGTSLNGKSAIINPDTNKFDREMAEEWLKTQPIPAEYIFNTPIPSSEGGMLYSYKASDGEIYKFEVGLEVNSFNSLLRYYDHEAGKYINCKAWQTAEIQSVLDMFEMNGIARETEARSYFRFPFQVPKFMSTTDRYSTGTFIGYSPYYWADENQTTTTTSSMSVANDAMIPHRHFVAKGPSLFSAAPGWIWSTGRVSATKMARSQGVSTYLIMARGAFDAQTNINSYVFGEISDACSHRQNYLTYNVEPYNGVATKVIQMPGKTDKNHKDPRWRNMEPNRGLSSGPIQMGESTDLKYTEATANSVTGTAEFFTPESVQMVPLIKL